MVQTSSSVDILISQHPQKFRKFKLFADQEASGLAKRTGTAIWILEAIGAPPRGLVEAQL